MSPLGTRRDSPRRASLPLKDFATSCNSTVGVTGAGGGAGGSGGAAGSKASDTTPNRHGRVGHEGPAGEWAGRSAAPPSALTTLVRMFVLGIDPGLTRCGYGCVETDGRRSRAVAAGVITTPKEWAVPHRLADLQRELRSLISEYRPGVVAIERVLFQHNVSTAISVGQASGLAMAEAATAGCTVVEYSPNQVKEAVAGHGGASKDEMERMVQSLLGIRTPLRPVDAADAIALALCHVAHQPAGALR